VSSTKAINSDRELISAAEAEERTGISQVQVSRWQTRLADEFKYRERQIQAAYRKADLERADNFRALGTGENEWFTPAFYIELARKVLGEIDLDPASHEKAQQTVRAAQFFSKEDDGTTREWHGRIWLNPPYSARLIRAFVRKLIEEIDAQRVSAAIMLTHNYTDSDWFDNAATRAAAVCFPRSRVKFCDIDGIVSSPTQGQAFFYFGSNLPLFHKVFRPLGMIWVPCDGI
jgi:hypothetical protein